MDILRAIVKKAFAKAGLKISKLETVEGRPDYSLKDLLPVINLRPGAVVVDGGANEGQSIDLLLEHSRELKIIAFEPDEELSELLRNKFGSYDNVSIISDALVDKAGTFKFNVYKSSKLSSIKNLNEESVQSSALARRVEVSGVTLDSFLQSHDIRRVDLLKLDLQGFEYEALKGAKTYIDSGAIDWIFAEVMFGDMYTSDDDHHADYLNILNLLSDNYVLYSMVDFNYGAKHRFSHCDLLFRRKTYDSTVQE